MLTKFAYVMIVASGAPIFVLSWSVMAVLGVLHMLTNAQVVDDLAEDLFDFALEIRRTMVHSLAELRK